MAAAALCDGDVKMVIWDLDGTLWRGTLDEADADDDLADGSLAPLIRLLAQRGIVSSVCSFNDEERACAALQRLGVWELIVFPAISFDSAFSKPAAIRATLSAAGLSPANALFCDDEPRHRAAAAAALPGLLTCAPSLLPPESALRRCGSADPGCSRLQKYRLLEARRRAEAAAVSQAGAGDAAAQRFLDSCEVVVRLRPLRGASDEDLDRLVALTQRTNRLNYTRRRRGWYWELLERDTDLLAPDRAGGGRGGGLESFTWKVYVSDRFGEHGLAGLVAVRRGALRHFLFSCRLLGLHVEAAVYQRLLASHALLPPPAGALPPQQHEALLRQRASHVKVELEDVSRTCRGRVPGEEAAEPMAAGCGGADFAGGAPPRALACGYCSLAPLGSLLEGRGWAVEMASDEYERFAVGSLLALRQYCSSPAAAAAIEREVEAAAARAAEEAGEEAEEVGEEAAAAEAAAEEAEEVGETGEEAGEKAAREEAREAGEEGLAAAARSPRLFEREQGAMRGGQYDVVVWDLERELLWPVATCSGGGGGGGSDGGDGGGTLLLPVDLQHALPRCRCPLVAAWAELWRVSHGTPRREELTDARLLSGVEVAAQIRWLRSALPAETSLLLLDVPPVWEDGSPTHSPGWQRTLAAFPASLRRGLEQRVACASVEVGRVVEELPNTALVRRAAALREGDLLEWVHTTRRAAAETAAAVVHAYADARACSRCSGERDAAGCFGEDSDGDIDVPRRRPRRPRPDEPPRRSPVPKAARPEAPPWALLDGVFTPSELARVIALCEQLDRSAVRDPEIAGFKLATTSVVHYSVSADGAPSFAGDEPPDPLLDTGWLFRPLVAALRRGDAALGGALPLRAFCTSVQYNRYDGGDHFEHFHVDEVECETAYKSLSLVLFLSRPDEYGGGEFELRRGEGGQVTALRPDANSAAVFCAREVFHRVRRVTRGARRTLVLWACATRASAVCDGPAEPCVAFGRIGASPFL